MDSLIKRIIALLNVKEEEANIVITLLLILYYYEEKLYEALDDSQRGI
jgi:hypothetical protein